MGSGNAGATNMLRTQGKIAALAVLLIDLGKGWVATGVLAPLAIPGVPPAELEMRALLVAVCGFVGLASMAGAGAVAAAIAARYSSERAPLLAFGIAAALLILYTHRANIGRMLAGTESRARRLWLFGLRRRQG